MSNRLRFRKASLWILVIALFFIIVKAIAIEHNQPDSAQQATVTETTRVNSHAEAESHASSEENHGSHADMTPLFFIIISLFIGIATKNLLSKSPLPFTITLLLIGLGVGLMERFGYWGHFNMGFLTINLDIIGKSLEWAGNMDPHVILFVFLPTLIFEASYNMEIHTFKKSFTNATILAAPGIVVALVITAVFCMWITAAGIGLNTWNWTVAFLFGTLISACDPVAVVSLLKELGASKKLTMLIDSEAILNDGTAIVIFMVFYSALTGNVSESNPFIEFLRVSLGGALLGAVIGWIVVAWLKRVLNDAMFEITIIIAAAYLAFFAAEKFFHISGVISVLALGLVMAGVGKTRISPEVIEFLHEFWELAAFLANVIIFIIVGVVIAQRMVITLNDLWIILLVYIAINIARALMIAIFYPLLTRIGYGLNIKESVVLWWGALRGAVGLALALIFANDPRIPQEIGNQVLLLTAGMVLLTSFINATTAKMVINWLGLTKISSAKALMMLNANRFLRQSSEATLEKIKNDRFLSGANWEKVAEFLPNQPDESIEENIDELLAENRKRILQKEKNNYWEDFEEGLLGDNAVRELSGTIDLMLDDEGKKPLSNRKDLEYLWKTPRILDLLQQLPLINHWARRRFFERLAFSYDCARGFVRSQENLLKVMRSLMIGIGENSKSAAEDEKMIEILENEINENRIQGLTFLRNLKEAFPEIYHAIETRHASRILLNHQKSTVNKLAHQHRIESDEAAKLIGEIEGKILKLMQTPPEMKMQVPVEMLREIEWIKDLPNKTFSYLVSLFQNRVFSVGENLVKNERSGEDIFILVRGTVKVIINKKVVDVLGPGDVIGEIAVLTGLPRTATVTAESPVTALRLPANVLQEAMIKCPELHYRLWKTAAERFAENELQQKEPYNKMTQQNIRAWLKSGEVLTLMGGQRYEFNNKIGFLLSGTVAYASDENKVLTKPCEIQTTQIIAINTATIFVLNKQ